MPSSWKIIYIYNLSSASWTQCGPWLLSKLFVVYLNKALYDVKNAIPKCQEWGMETMEKLMEHTHIYMIINGPWWLTSGVFIQQPHGKLTSSTNGDTTQHSPHSSWSPRIRSCWKKNPWWYTKCSIKLAPLRIITLPFTKVFPHLLVKLFTLFVRCQSFSTKEKSTSEKWSKLTGFPGLPTRHDGPVWPKATKFFQHGSGHMTVPKKG